MQVENTINFDHHYHGAFDFSPKWRFVQGYWFGNLLKQIVDTALKKNIQLISLVSEDFGEEEKCGGIVIGKDSIHNKFAQIERFALRLPKEYGHDVDQSVMKIEHNGKEVYIIHTQVPIVKDKGRRLDHLVIGGNHERTIPNLLPLDETNEWINDNYDTNQIIRVAEHIGLEEHFGLTGEKFLEEFRNGNYDALEFNAQMINPSNLNALRYKIPFLGSKLKVANKGLNEANRDIAMKHNIPMLYGSDGHRVEHIGLACSRFPYSSINTSSALSLLRSLRINIIANNFKGQEGYASCLQWTRWLSEFVVGHGIKMPHPDLTAVYRKGTFKS
ncbi:hypothetical protein J4477_02320 [Candidatus Pacearchaeota archaeon]|nr:hypothetical protein [Candidatus Pacearchaeota archaeon]